MTRFPGCWFAALLCVALIGCGDTAGGTGGDGAGGDPGTGGVGAIGGAGGSGGVAGPSCGDGNVDTGEECDDGNESNSDSCPDDTSTDPAGMCLNAVCGDGHVLTGTEGCDDGNTEDGDGCSATCQLETCGNGQLDAGEDCDDPEDPTCQGVNDQQPCRWVTQGFRIRSLGLFDPVIVFPTLCGPFFTDTVNNQLTGSSVDDYFSFVAPPESLDGLIDLGFVFTFQKANQDDGADSLSSFVVSDCNRFDKPSPVPNPSPCSPTVIGEPSQTAFTVTTQTSGTCLAEIPGTTDRSPTPVDAGDNGCFVAGPINFNIILGTILTIPLEDAFVSAQWDGNPATGLVNGLVRGWISREAADALTVPPLQFTPEQSLSEAFIGPSGPPGMEVDCTSYDDNNGEEGFWIHFTFEAEPVPWNGGPMCGNGVVDTGGDRDELCDPAIEAPAEGSCDPLLECDDSLACTRDVVNNGDPCAPRCFYTGIRDNEDACCPLAGRVDDALSGPGEFPERIAIERLADDADCVGTCGDGTVQDWEDCDTAAGGEDLCDESGAAQCDDGDSCTVDSYRESNACVCLNDVITAREPDDGCCPDVCSGPNPPANCGDDTDCAG